MRTTLYIILATLLFLHFNSCSKNFLYEKTDLMEMNPDTIFIISASEKHNKQISISSSINAEYTIAQYPKFMKFDSMKGSFTSGVSMFTFTSVPDLDYFKNNGITIGQLVLDVKGYGMIGYTVKISNSTQQATGNIKFYDTAINFGTEQSKEFALYNDGTGTATWSITNLPNWLTANKISGALIGGALETIIFTVNRNSIPSGHHTSSVSFSFNETSSFFLSVSMDVEGGTVVLPNANQIEGYVVAAEFIKSTNKLVILTQQPNRLLLLNTDDNSQTTIDLPKKPFCMAINEDGSMAVVGYAVAQLSTIDLNDKKVLKNLDLPFVPFNITIGANDWCYVTSNSDNNYRNLVSLNLQSNTIIQKFSYEIREKNIIAVVPNKKVLLTYSTQVSPSHFVFADISNDTITSDFAVCYSEDTAGAIWFIKDGLYVINRGKEVLKLSTNTFDDVKISKYGSLDGNYQSIQHVDECAEKGLLALSVHFGYTSPAGTSFVSLWDFESFSELRQINAPIIDNSITYIYFSFLNSSGNKLFIILRNNNDPYSTTGNWYLETVDL